MKKLLVCAAVCSALLVVPAASQAYTTKDKGWTNYVGKTKEGSKISFAYRRGVISIISTMVPSTCASGQGGTPRARMTMFDPPQSVIFRVNGRESQKKVKEPWPERYYTITATKKGKRIKGKLRISWSLLTSGTFGGYSILTCRGDGNFNLKPQKK